MFHQRHKALSTLTQKIHETLCYGSTTKAKTDASSNDNNNHQLLIENFNRLRTMREEAERRFKSTSKNPEEIALHQSAISAGLATRYQVGNCQEFSGLALYYLLGDETCFPRTAFNDISTITLTGLNEINVEQTEDPINFPFDHMFLILTYQDGIRIAYDPHNQLIANIPPPPPMTNPQEAYAWINNIIQQQVDNKNELLTYLTKFGYTFTQLIEQTNQELSYIDNYMETCTTPPFHSMASIFRANMSECTQYITWFQQARHT